MAQGDGFGTAENILLDNKDKQYYFWYKTNEIGKEGGRIVKKVPETTTINIRDFPLDLHRRVKAQAALMGISIKEFILRAVTEYLKKQK